MSSNVINLAAFSNARRASPPAQTLGVPQDLPKQLSVEAFDPRYDEDMRALSYSPQALQQERWTNFSQFNPPIHYRQLARQFDWTFATDESGRHWFGDTPEFHEQVVSYFTLFGLRYDDYARVPAEEFSGLFDALHWRVAGWVLDYIENPAHFAQATAFLPEHCRAWMRGVALGEPDTWKAPRALAAVVKAKQNLNIQVMPRNYGFGVREWGFERFRPGRYWYPEQYRFVPFERDEHGRCYVPDAEEHASFSGHASAYGYEYRDIATDRAQLDAVAEILIGAVSQGIVDSMGRKWDKGAAEKLFASCSPKVLRYLSAVHGGRMDTVWKLRDEVFPELQAWAKNNPAKKGKLTAYGRQD